MSDEDRVCCRMSGVPIPNIAPDSSGLSDRIEALGGTLQLNRPTGSRTSLLLEIPFEVQNGAVSTER